MKIVDQKTMGKIAKKLRMTTGYPQDMVADVLLVTRATYSYKELGKSAMSTEDIQRLAALYQVPIDTFFAPELAEEIPMGRRIKRKPSMAVETLGKLSKEERKLIGLLRFSQSQSESEEMTKRLQELVRKEIEQEK